jgi:tripartite-type tricarboxylate transporter receptor subunit TctC
MKLINKPGGHGIVAMNYVNSEPADGYTILGLEGSQIIGMVEGKTKLSLLTDFIPILKAVETPMAIYARTDSPYKTFKQLVDAIKADPQKVTVGATDAVGGVFNVAAIQVFKNAGTDIKYMSFAGEASRMLPAALGGHVDAVLDVVSVFDPHVAAGKMRALCVLTDERLSQYPDTPTLKELGYNVGVPKHWRGMAVKKGTPPERVALIRKVIVNGLNSSMFRSIAETKKMNIAIVEGQEFVDFLNGQLETFKIVLKNLGLLH